MHQHEIDPGERLSVDDEATRTEEQFRARAMALQAARAAAEPRPTPGCCANCGSSCLPLAVYCDADCRADHEARARGRRA